MLFFDIEIIATIDKTKPYIPFKNVCDWNDKKSMGIAVCGFYIEELDSLDWFTLDKEYFLNPEKPSMLRQFFGENLSPAKTQEENSKSIELFKKYSNNSVGFNSRQFDDSLLRVNGFTDFKSQFDLLEMIRLSAFGSTNWEDQPKGYSYNLETLSLANLNYGKSGKGKLAPVLWQQKKYQNVIGYCLDDVKILRDLFNKFKSGQLIDPNTKQRLKYRG